MTIPLIVSDCTQSFVSLSVWFHYRYQLFMQLQRNLLHGRPTVHRISLRSQQLSFYRHSWAITTKPCMSGTTISVQAPAETDSVFGRKDCGDSLIVTVAPTYERNTCDWGHRQLPPSNELANKIGLIPSPMACEPKSQALTLPAHPKSVEENLFSNVHSTTISLQWKKNQSGNMLVELLSMVRFFFGFIILLLVIWTLQKCCALVIKTKMRGRAGTGGIGISPPPAFVVVVVVVLNH
ncbi:hypothetical protein GCK32_002483 [Trichostrongylus colubriformis]|uniref:Uncharacterized protein n=1 Tax=Trichostrongylus colubriformis TaxID=6319 RepID=A0AAN8FB96_TRICO